MNGGVRAVRRGRPADGSGGASETGYLDEQVDDLADAVCPLRGGEGRAAPAQRRPVRQRGRRAAGAAPDADSRPTSSPTRRRAHDPLNGYVPNLMTLAGGRRASRGRPDEYVRRRQGCLRGALRGDGRLPRRRGGGVRLRQQPARRGSSSAASSGPSPIPGFVAAYIRPLFCEGKGPFRWVALSGEPADIEAHRPRGARGVPGDQRLARWIRLAGERIAFQGLPARICWARLRRAPPARAALQRDGARSGELRAPIVIGRDHLDAGSVASPYRETEAMRRRLRRDRRLAAPERARQHGLPGPRWVSIHHGGGVGIGRSIHAGHGVRRRREPSSPRRSSSGC